MAISEALGSVHEVELSKARIRYRERGKGPPVVFVHGLMANGDLWRKVVPPIAAAGFRCFTPDWPLGAHDIPVPRADLSPSGVAALIAEFLDELDLSGAVVIANDTGGALTQILMVNHSDRIGAVVLTPSDAFRRFFPPTFAALPRLARVPGAVQLFVHALRLRALHRMPVTFGWVAKRPLPREIVDSFLLPSRRDSAVRHDLRRFLLGVDKRHTLAAAERLSAFSKPVLLAWAREEKLFPVSMAERLAMLLPSAELRLIDDSYTFIPEDRADRLTPLVVDFLRVHATT